jgi:hypothetical protein
MDTASSAATAAENRPVYSATVCVCSNENGDTMTHENEDSIGIFLPAVGHLVVFFLCNL